MASYDKTKNADYTLAVQAALKTLGANLGSGGVDGKWGKYTEKAYQENKAAVDQLVAGIGGSGFGTGLNPAQVDVPGWKDFDELLSIGNALYAAQFEAGRLAAQKQLEQAQKQVEDNRVKAAANTENAANARGFGRSTYVTDALASNERAAQSSQSALLTGFADALARLEAERTAAAAQYAGSMWKAQQDAVLSAQKFNAQMQQETNLAQWKQAQSAAGKRGGGGSSGKKSTVDQAVSEEAQRQPSTARKGLTAQERRRIPMGIKRAE